MGTSRLTKRTERNKTMANATRRGQSMAWAIIMWMDGGGREWKRTFVHVWKLQFSGKTWKRSVAMYVPPINWTIIHSTFVGGFYSCLLNLHSTLARSVCPYSFCHIFIISHSMPSPMPFSSMNFCRPCRASLSIYRKQPNAWKAWIGKKCPINLQICHIISNYPFLIDDRSKEATEKYWTIAGTDRQEN